jgi:lipopolysaccharide/colanic/teichoic acid biosynthesis glycosyltransferase
MVGLLFGLEFACLYLGLLYTDAARSVLFVYLSPFIVAVGAHLFLRGDRLTLFKILGLVLAFAGILLVLLSPLFVLLALAIKLTSKGPVLYIPLSVGKDGEAFRFYKFRSMYHNVPDESHRELIEQFISGKKQDGTKLRNDPRITPIGRLIRKFSLDELPQLWSILKGDIIISRAVFCISDALVKSSKGCIYLGQ